MKHQYLPGWGLAFALITAAAIGAEPIAWETGPGHRSARVTPTQPGKAGFTLLSAAQTGLHFTNLLSVETAAKNHNLMQGAGVAAGDFDGDGLCDLYFCNVEGRNALYRNLGGFRFADVTEQAGVTCPGLFSTGAIFADVNGDGRPDLLVAANNGLALFLNEGGGHFTNTIAAAGLITKPLGATSIALADLDGNGTLDLFVANYGENTILRSGGEISVRTVNGKPVVSGRAGRRLKIINGIMFEFGEPSSVYLNDGKGQFTPLSWTDGNFLDEDGKPLKELPMDLSLSVVLRDINGDGRPDIYVCNDFQSPDRIWINEGAGRFRALPRLAMRKSSNFSMGVDFADLDRDGRDDFVVVDMLSRHHALKMTQMIETNFVPSLPGEIENRPPSRRNTLFWNRGDGTYAEIANFAGLAASDWSWTPAFLDVDLDGYEDLLISNSHAYDTLDLDTSMLPVMKGPSAARDNLVRFPKLETPNNAFRNRGDLTFEEVGTAWGFNSTQVCHGIIFADLDNDGDQDVVVSSLNGPPLIYRNDSPAPRVAVRLKGLAPNTRGINARITVHGGAVPLQSQEMVAGGRYLSADEPLRTFAAGALTNRMTIEVGWRNGTRSLVTNALPNRIYEIDEAGAKPLSVRKPETLAITPLFRDMSSLLGHQHHEEAFDDFARQPLLSRKLSQLGPGVAWVDLDGDGRDDWAVGSGRNGDLSFGHIGPKASTGFNLTNVASDDLLGLTSWVSEGKRSLLVARSSYESGNSAALLRVTSENRSVTVRTQEVAIAASPGPLAVADLDGDGALELFVGGRITPGRYPESSPSQIFRQNQGRLTLDAVNTSALQSASLVSSAVWSDLDGDGFPELILACEWGPIRVFKNDAGKLREATKEWGLEKLTGWWTSVTTGDLDGDGKLDLIAGNWGLNSGYHAAPVAPLRLFYGDLSGDGSQVLVEAELDQELNKVVPRENLTQLAPAMPYLRAKFPTYAAFRNVSVNEALAEHFSQAKQAQANTLASMVFFNRGDHFEAVPLPTEAQWAPVFGLNVADMDGDGDEDVFLAQNFFATRKDIPRLDGGRGLWLRNDGRGHLTPVPGTESGVIIWGEQRGSAVGDFDQDGRVDLLVAQNGAATKLFHNEKAKPGLRVRLQGATENPDGIGAVLRLQSGEGFGPAREIHGGSGYLSQDSLVAVLGMRAPPTKIIVRWPGGKTTETAVSNPGSTITVNIGQ